MTFQATPTDHRCDSCGCVINGPVTSTGHVIGAWYLSNEYDLAFQVVGACTVWEWAPEAAVTCRWTNGAVTRTQRLGRDAVMVCGPCQEVRMERTRPNRVRRQRRRTPTGLHSSEPRSDYEQRTA